MTADPAGHSVLLGCFTDASALRARGLFAAEGRFVVERLIAAGNYAIELLVVTPPARVAMAASLERVAADVPLVELSPRELQRLVGYPLDRGCVALVRRPPPTLVTSLVAATSAESHSVWLVLENVSNPDNVGGLFRSAAAFGVSAVVLVGGCADPLYRKSVRTSLGNTLTVPHASVASAGEALAAFAVHGVVSVALVAHGGIDLHRWTPAAPHLALWVGHEGDGLSAGAVDGCAHRVSIAMPGAIDSLNVAVAGAIALHHVTGPGPASAGTQPRARVEG